MRLAIIIPAHNEEQFIAKTLDSLLQQSYKAASIVVVNDHSTDGTAQIVEQLAQVNRHVNLINNTSSNKNVPGTKVINAFNIGLQSLDSIQYDIICKFDADLIFPPDYIEQIVGVFEANRKAGIVAGHCSVEIDGAWQLENATNKDHVRGALKAYRRGCFEQIEGLKPSIGWDTVDEMLARFYGWDVVTIPHLHVKHLKPTGASYHAGAQLLQGEAFYKIRYGWLLTAITAAKMAWNKKDMTVFKYYLKGYRIAKQKNLEPLVTAAQGNFIRSYRWRGIKAKLFS